MNSPTRLTSHINLLLGLAAQNLFLNLIIPHQATLESPANVARITGLTSSGDFWISVIVDFVSGYMNDERVSLAITFDDSVRAAWLEAMDVIKRMSKLKREFCFVEILPGS